MQTLFQGIDPAQLTHHHLTADKVMVLADTTIDTYGSAAMKQCNQTLKAWRRVWDGFRGRHPSTRPHTFCAEPLPFWYLAKLYQVLYLFRDPVGVDVDLELPMGRGSHDPWRPEVNDKIISWLSSFREQACSTGVGGPPKEPTGDPEGECEASVMSKLMKSA